MLVYIQKLANSHASRVPWLPAEVRRVSSLSIPQQCTSNVLTGPANLLEGQGADSITSCCLKWQHIGSSKAEVILLLYGMLSWACTSNKFQLYHLARSCSCHVVHWVIVVWAKRGTSCSSWAVKTRNLFRPINEQRAMEMLRWPPR